jgi:predicted hydrocarbon binding protein
MVDTHINRAEADESRPKSFRERLTWHADVGEVRDGDIRYMLIRPDALMAVFAQLEPAARDAAFAAFHNSITAFGARSAATYVSDRGPPLIEVVAETAPQLGWGRMALEKTAHGYNVTVTNSPFAAGIGTADRPVCTPITGMLQAVGKMMTGADVQVAETHCTAQDGLGPCCFTLRASAAWPA